MHLDIEAIISAFGGFAVFGILAIIFAETGLLVGFFLPGDSLLFVTGLMLSQGAIQVAGNPVPLWLMCALISLTAFAGDQTGYWIGRKLGPAVFNKPDSRFFSHKNVDRAHAFFERYGSRAVILAHFVPVMRTFVPVAAGVGEMNYSRFIRYNVIGVLSWGTGVTLLGYWLGGYEVVKKNIELFAIGFVVLSTIPIAIELLRERRANKKSGN
ncbi:MAG: DedA family protein [Micrococcales bacterium]